VRAIEALARGPLGSNNPNRSKLRTCGACYLVLHVLDAVALDARAVQLDCLRAVVALAQSSPKNADALISFGAYRVIYRLQATYGEDMEMHSVCETALTRLQHERPGSLSAYIADQGARLALPTPRNNSEFGATATSLGGTSSC
jgi:hypothetical protein